ncbi:HD-GYP domain-containing protein [Pseudoduganella violacea]|uniref:HD-GYP domain-containing protein (C-di-GMP phosphodiesterase class II) n=1 Tax=Pseudoduganella violacea TaxID=1715466 RepID=A0A7W5FVY6_9BURK|nr:HD domain-containing phosphohydrolase [Pseudoduganella violacea]MBB3121249.1 HD-GYP domain-containing protein (c-di-GMP phosphodiesterase class II) [Pseudoduganella violacea]
MNQQLSSLKELVLGDATSLPVPTSVLHELNHANRRLEKLLQQLRNEHNADAELRSIARDVIHAVELNPEIALACIYLNQIAGTYAVRHCIEVAVIVVLVARGMQKQQRDILTMTAAALTMNVGMLKHHDRFQSKPGALNSEDMAIVRRHPEDSAEILKCAGIDDEEWLSCVLLHHENHDGSGYPAGKSGEDITLNARLLSYADRYCAQVSARNYRCSLLPDEALNRLQEELAADADAPLREQFHRQIGKYPPGCLVRLENGEIGVIVHRDVNRESGDGVLTVHCLRDAAGKLPPAVILRSSSDGGCGIAEVLSEDQVDLRFSMKQIWGAQASL